MSVAAAKTAFISWNIHCCNNTLKLVPSFHQILWIFVYFTYVCGFAVALCWLICAHFCMCHRRCRLSEYKLIVPKCKIDRVCVHLFRFFFRVNRFFQPPPSPLLLCKMLRCRQTDSETKRFIMPNETTHIQKNLNT